MSPGYTALTVRREHGVAVVTLDHPPVNLLDTELIADLDRLHAELATDPTTRVVVVESANPDFFLAHGDLRLLTDPAALDAYVQGPGLDLFQRYRALPQLTIAKVTGRVRGGGAEFLLHLDLRYAALGNAWFGQPEVSLGIFPGGGGTRELPALLGRARALEVILSGQLYDAATAERYGWIDRALPAAELDPFVAELAHRIAAQPPAAVAAAIAAIDAALPARPDSAEREMALLMPLFTSADAIDRAAAALAAGAQTVAGERDLEGLIERATP
ncbi:enoyl-CoA hydratase/isomerase family protein [Nocardia sp. NPDC057227]|uniref:enoyl-CoA hydratase/isomerase family protein n=1 Tax=Nocardia sp. NPDC057227 TaxID=3346056 RepID=UPI0036459475